MGGICLGERKSTPFKAPDFGSGEESVMIDAQDTISKSGPAFGPRPGADESNKSEPRSSASPTVAATANAPDNVSKAGLTSDAAQRQLAKFGPNAMPDTGINPLAMVFEKFWAPVPWMLEAAIVLELVLGKYVEASIIALLLVFNAALGLFQESRAQATLAALKSRLALTASVKRDGAWKIVPATDLAPGDLVKLSLGGRGRSRCEAYGRRSSPRPIHAHRRIGAYRGRRPVFRPTRGRWFGAARPRRRLRRPAYGPNSAVPPNSCAPRMS